jgi:hypothetical protein
MPFTVPELLYLKNELTSVQVKLLYGAYCLIRIQGRKAHEPDPEFSPIFAAFSPRRSRLSLGPSLRPRLCLRPSRSSPSSAVRLPRRLLRSLLLLYPSLRSP